MPPLPKKKKKRKSTHASFKTASYFRPFYCLLLSAAQPCVHVQVEAYRDLHLFSGNKEKKKWGGKKRKKPSGHFASASNPSSASVAHGSVQLPQPSAWYCSLSSYSQHVLSILFFFLVCILEQISKGHTMEFLKNSVKKNGSWVSIPGLFIFGFTFHFLILFMLFIYLSIY